MALPILYEEGTSGGIICYAYNGLYKVCTSVRSSDNAHEKLSAYSELVSSLMKTYVTDEMIAKTSGESSSRQEKGTFAAEFALTLYEQALRYGNLYRGSQLT